MIRRRLLSLGFLAIVALSVAVARAEKVLYEKQSPYNTVVVTEDEEGLRTLWFERYGARQSVVKVGDPDHLELAYARVMPVGVAVVEEPKRVLIVGLGGGTVPSFLHKHYPKTQIDVVDIDPVVVDVAGKFFGFREDETLHAHVADGRRFIEKCKNPYDIIFLDAFGSDNIPYALATREFLQAVRRALTPKGIVVGNIWSQWSNPLHDSMVRTYQDVFDELYIFDAQGAGNEILLALPRKGPIERDDLARKARAISKQEHFPYDLGDVVTYGYRDARNEHFGGRVLLDKDKPEENP
jgi:spermidine synthase